MLEGEIVPLFKTLANSNTDPKLRQSLVNYVVIRLVSSIENFFSNEIRRLIDCGDFDLSSLVRDMSEFDKVCTPVYTRGKLIGCGFNFANSDAIQDVASELLKLDFFDTVRTLDRLDPYWHIKGTLTLEENWFNFLAMFELRTDIVHALADAKLTDIELMSLCDNTMNVLDAAAWIFHKDFLFEKELRRLGPRFCRITPSEVL
jgi:hypothetical protein